MGGFPTRALFYQPRFGVAYDLFGNGKTVLRGGWGRYYYHSGQFTTGLDVSRPECRPSQSRQQRQRRPAAGASNLDTLNFADQALSPAAVDSKDDRQPLHRQLQLHHCRSDCRGRACSKWPTSATRATTCRITRRQPASNINLVPVGAMLASNNGGVDPNSLTANNFRPLQGFSDLNLATNNVYANYNSLQVTWVAHQGPLHRQHELHLRQGDGDRQLDATTVQPGQQLRRAGHQPHPHLQHGLLGRAGQLRSDNKIAGGFVNGWQLSGITQVQSGANLTGNSGGRTSA